MVAFANAGLHPCKPAPPADKHVQPLGDWAMGRKALWLGQVCRILGGHGSCRSAGKLFDRYSRIASRRIEQFPDQESRRSFGRRLGCVVWDGWRALRFWSEIPARVA